MKTFSLVVFALVIVAAITPIASAWAVGDNYQVSWDLTTGQVYTLTRAEANGYCQAAWGTNAANIGIYGDSFSGIHLCANSSGSASQVSCMALAGTNGTSMVFDCVSHLTPMNRYKDIYRIPDFTATPTSFPAGTNTVIEALRVLPGNWTFSLGDGNTTTGSRRLNHIYSNPGNYSVIMRQCAFFNANDCYTVTKMEYITVGAPNATATTYAVARDLYTGFAIQNAEVDMYDVENTSWTNTTALNGEGSITTLLGHTINIWGSATGYDDDNLIGVPAVDGGYYSLLLRPTNLTTYNSTPGNLTLAVTVQDLQIPHNTISGAEVTAAWGAQYAAGTSNAAGSVFFTVPNNTAVHLSAFKSGYASGSSTHITGTANGGSTMETAIVYIGTDYVTPTITTTLTTGPGGTVPPTVDPCPCIGDGSAQDTLCCQKKQGSMAADLISYGPDLVRFFIMLTFIGGLLLITGKR